LIQCGPVVLAEHGVPSFHKKYYPSDKSRAMLKMPIYDGTKSGDELRKYGDNLDAYYGSDEFKISYFGPKKAKKYVYQPVIRHPKAKDDDDDDDEEDSKKSKKTDKKKSNAVKPDYIKMALHIAEEDGKITNLTKLKKKEGKVYKPVVATTIPEVSENINHMSEVTIVFCPTRLWYGETEFQGQFLYGIAHRVLAIDFIKGASRTINAEDLEMDHDDDEREAKLDSDDEAPKKSKKKVESDDEAPKKSKKKVESDDEDAPKKSKKKVESDDEDAPKKSKKKVESDDEDVPKKSKKKVESDDEDAPKKSKKKVESDDDAPKKSKKKVESDDEDDIPVKTSKKKSTKADSDDDEAVVKPKRKSRDA